MLQIILLIIVFPVAWFALPFAIRRLSEARLAQRCRDRNAIVLSFDDGPSSRLTPDLLDLLARRQVPATFFALGRHVEPRTEIVRHARRDGHEIGSHTFHHSNAWKTGPIRAARDLVAGIRAISDPAETPRLFRPPFGKLTLGTLAHCLILRQKLAWWTIDSKDAREGSAGRPVEAILADIAAAGGGVVLAHDFDRKPSEDTDPPHADYVINLTEKIIEFAEQNGYRIMRLGDVLQGSAA